jgi:hypothetical protein
MRGKTKKIKKLVGKILILIFFFFFFIKIKKFRVKF